MIQKTNRKSSTSKICIFWKIERFDPMKPLKKLYFVQKPTFLMIFLKCFSTLNAPCHFSKKKFMPSDRGKTLRKNDKNVLMEKNIILMNDFVGLNRTLPKTCLKIVTKTLENRFIFWCIFREMQKHIVFLKLYVVVGVILKKSFDFVVDFLQWFTGTKMMFFLLMFEYQRFCIDFFNLRN